MVRKWRPVVSLAAAVGVLAWIVSILPLGHQSANAQSSSVQAADGQSSLRMERLGSSLALSSIREDQDEDRFQWLRERDEERFFVDHDDDDEHEDWDDDEEEEEYEEEEWEEEDIERELMYLEIRRAEIQAAFGELELVREVASIVESPEATASLVVISVADEIDDEEQKVEALTDLLDVAKSDAVKRLILLQLAEVYGDIGEDEKAYRVVRRLVAEE
ncbi:MAG: hypothetical protein AAGJ46_10540 [Planctomycetota bacterium]